MPLVRISTRDTYTLKQIQRIGEIVYECMHIILRVPNDDNFQILTRHDEGSLVYDKHYLGIDRSDGIVMIQITLNDGRSADLKKAFYKDLVDNLYEKMSIRHEDVFINLIEVPSENWSFVNGLAHYS